MGPLVTLLAALPIALLPVEPGGVPAEAVRAAELALRKSLPPPFEAAALDAATLAEHLAASGPACRSDLLCLCSVAPFEEKAGALDLRLEQLPELKAWSADLRLVIPCLDLVVNRRAEALPQSPAALTRWIGETVVALLRGRDLGEVRWSAKGGVSAKKAKAPAVEEERGRLHRLLPSEPLPSPEPATVPSPAPATAPVRVPVMPRESH